MYTVDLSSIDDLKKLNLEDLKEINLKELKDMGLEDLKEMKPEDLDQLVDKAGEEEERHAPQGGEESDAAAYDSFVESVSRTLENMMVCIHFNVCKLGQFGSFHLAR